MYKQKMTLTIELSPIEDRFILTVCDEKQKYTRIMSERFSYDLRNQIPLQDVAIKHLTYSFEQITPIVVSTVLGLKEKENDDLELDGPITEKDITGGEVLEDEDNEEETEDETDEEEIEEEDGLF